MPWFAPFMFVGGVAAATAGVVWNKRREAKRLAVWRRLAADMGATFVEPGGFWRPHPAAIIADLGVARVYVDTKTEHHGNSSTTYTRARVGFPLGVAPHFKVYKDGLLSSIGSRLGMRDVELGEHRDFDDWFAVRSPGSADWLNLLWTHRAKDLAVRCFPRGRFECDGKTLQFKEVGIFRDSQRIRDLFGLMGMLGNADLYGRRVLQAVDGATYRETEGPWDGRSRPFATLDLPSRVVVGPEYFDGRLATVARLKPDVKVTDLDVVVGPEQEAGDTGGLPSATKPYLQRMGHRRRLRLQIESGRALLVWNQIADDPAEIRQAAELLATLVPAGVGVYR